MLLGTAVGLPKAILDTAVTITSAIAITSAITVAIGGPGELEQTGVLNRHVSSPWEDECCAGKLSSASQPGCHSGGGSKMGFESTYQVSGPRR